MKQKSLTIALLTLCLMGLAAFLTSCDSRCFIGNCSVAPDAFRLDIDRMTGTDRFTMELSAGDMLAVQFETAKVYIQQMDGKKAQRN